MASVRNVGHTSTRGKILRKHHDFGGLPDEPITFSDHDFDPWEKMITALWVSVRSRGFSNLDEMRRLCEDLPPDVYDRGYNHARAEAMANILHERGVLSRTELAERMALLQDRIDATP